MNADAADTMDAQTDPALLRKDLYTLLAFLLAGPPTSDALADLASLATAPGIPFPLEAALMELKQAAARTDAASAAQEYADLFIGMGRGEIVPYASYYGSEKLLMAGPLARLRTDLPAAGIRRNTDVCEPEDHAAALCESMVLIIGRPEPPGAPPSIAAQARFFGAHIAPWINRFFKDLHRARSAVFYRVVARLGEQFMLLEKQLLQEHAMEEG